MVVQRIEHGARRQAKRGTECRENGRGAVKGRLDYGISNGNSSNKPLPSLMTLKTESIGHERDDNQKRTIGIDGQLSREPSSV
jgi:hypothetical protein